MGFIAEVVAAVLIVLAAGALIWMVVGKALTPVCCGKSGTVCTVLQVNGHCPEIEQTVDGILWLKSNGILETKIIIADCGMDDETRSIVDIMTKQDEKVLVCGMEDLKRFMAEEI